MYHLCYANYQLLTTPLMCMSFALAVVLWVVEGREKRLVMALQWQTSHTNLIIISSMQCPT